MKAVIYCADEARLDGFRLGAMFGVCLEATGPVSVLQGHNELGYWLFVEAPQLDHDNASYWLHEDGLYLESTGVEI